jgi:hypothetical protein
MIPVAVACVVGATPAVAQRSRPVGGPPDLSPGDRVRVWAFPGPRITGILTAYTPDSLSIFGHEGEGIPVIGRVAFPPPTRRYDLYWVNVRRIDVPHGRDVIRGIGGGVAGALVTGAMVSALCTGFGGQHSQCGFWRWSARSAVFTIPLGAVIGFLSTRWKRVY